MHTRLIRVASLCASVGISLGLLAVSAAPAEAARYSLGTHDLIVQNSPKAVKDLKICRTWSPIQDDPRDPWCLGQTAILHNSWWSDRAPYYWQDTAAVKVNAGWTLMQDIVGPDAVIYPCRSRTFYGIVGPTSRYGVINHHRKFYLKDCPQWDQVEGGTR